LYISPTKLASSALIQKESAVSYQMQFGKFCCLLFDYHSFNLLNITSISVRKCIFLGM